MSKLNGKGIHIKIHPFKNDEEATILRRAWLRDWAPIRRDRTSNSRERKGAPRGEGK